MGKKKTPVETTQGPALPEPEDIVIHVMPAKYRTAGAVASDHSRTGILIIVMGLVFMVAMVAGFYFIFFRTTPVATEEDVADQVSAPAAESPARAEEAPVRTAPATSPEPSPAAATPSPAATSAPENTDLPEPAIPAVATDLKPAPDTDNDGLSDQSETVFGTDPTKIDSDGDAYGDLDEIKAGYDPAGPGRLETSPALASYTNAPFRYRLFYPAAWGVTKFGGDESLVFTSPDKQFVQVIVQPNPDKEPIGSWYGKQFGEGSDVGAESAEGQGWRGLWSPDGLTLYLTDINQEYLYVLTYNLGADNSPYYSEIFRLMAGSLKTGVY